MNTRSAAKTSEPKAPNGLRKVLASKPAVEAKWKDLTPIARRDFITWIDSAKQAETHSRRIERTCSMLASGKRRPCCYAVVPMDIYKALGADHKAKIKWKNLVPDERRDFIAWIEAAPAKEKKAQRIDKALAMIASGKRRP